VNQKDGSIILIDSYMTTPVCARLASLEHTGTEPGLQPFHGPNHLHRFAKT
jgi:hypothetical protein